MAIMTKKMIGEMQDLLDAANAGLPVTLGRFIRRSIRGIYATEKNFESRADLQEHIDTLRDLIDVKVHSR